jgi:murein DD-endopeptidase MepM/ murein hydrolase activator NlpD
MPKSKYKFNPESLSYLKIERSLKQRILIAIGYFFMFMFIGAIGYAIISSFHDTPKVKGLKRQISLLKTNYETFNKDLNNVESLLEYLQERDDNIYRTIFEAEPVHQSVRNAGFGGSNRYSDLELTDAEIVVQTAKRLDKIRKKIYVQSVSYDELIDLATNKEKMVAAVPAIQPISNKDLKRTASGWGYRIHPIYKIRKFHYGMDFTAPTGTEVYATGDGTIEIVNSSKRGYGNKIVVNHGFGYKTLYAHLSGFNVKVGQKVKRGDVIGYVGNTGMSTAPHLHYEVHLNNKKVNPINYYFNDLTASEYDKMIELSTKFGKSFD